jgi:hypothetical protein
MMEIAMNEMVKKFVCCATIAGFLGGCATSGKDVAATYVSPIQYSNYDCDQLRQELARVNGRVGQITGRLDEAAGNDKALVGLSLIFWPALFALGGTKQQEAELSRLKGEYEALQTASTSKKCS